MTTETPHKHRDIIIAWAEGKDIEWRSCLSSSWSSLPKHNATFADNLEYRLKPKTVKKYYWVYWDGNERPRITVLRRSEEYMTRDKEWNNVFKIPGTEVEEYE